jgi:hypothetical protein
LRQEEYIEKLISILLFLGLFLNLAFVYFAQERVFFTESTGINSLGSEKYLRILSVILIFLTTTVSVFKAKSQYHYSIYIAYLLLLIYICFNFYISGASFSNMTHFMDKKGVGTWICLGLIFVSYNDKRYLLFQKFVLFSIVYISLLSIYNIIDFGIGGWRMQAMSKYRIYAVNLVWLVPYAFLILKNNKKLKILRVYIMIIGIVVSLIIQTRSFLIIYVLTIIFDFINTKNKTQYTFALGIGFIGFTYLVLSTDVLSASYDLIVNRGTHDTRSEQLALFFSQLDFFEIITGKGYYASYFASNGEFSYVDNQWLFLLWWGGLIPCACYFYLSAIVPLKVIFINKMEYETKVECFVLIIWVLGLGGLAIFSTMSIDFFFFIISIMLGRVLYKYSLYKKHNDK